MASQSESCTRCSPGQILLLSSPRLAFRVEISFFFLKKLTLLQKSNDHVPSHREAQPIVHKSVRQLGTDPD